MLINVKYNKIVIIVCLILLLYVLLIFSAKNIETTSTFPANINLSQNFVPYSDSSNKYEEINIKSSKGENINGLYVGNGKGKTVFYFHGNGGPISYFYNDINYIASLGYNVMAYDYPGYGKSEGKSHKANVDIFSKEFYEYVKEKKGLKNTEIIVWGYSVGTAVAVDFANRYNFEKLVLVSPFSSRYDMSKKIFGFPVQKFLFLKNSYVTSEVVKSFHNPVLIIHGNNDKIVPFNQGKTVFENYGEFFINQGFRDKVSKYFIEIDNFGHNNILDNYGEILKYTIADFLNEGKLDFTEMFLDSKQIEKLKKENKLKAYDLFSDNSFTKFLNNKVSFYNLGYIPENLEDISSEYIFDSKGNGKLRDEANLYFQKLAKSFYEKFNKKLVVVSSYRSYDYQKGIKSGGCPDNLCAKAGYSEHQLGLAVDIFAASNQKDWQTNKDYKKYFEWFNNNAHKYGFHNTYQKGVGVDGYEIEPWHWRYLGIKLATHLKNNNKTIAEFYNSYYLELAGVD